MEYSWKQWTEHKLTHCLSLGINICALITGLCHYHHSSHKYYKTVQFSYSIGAFITKHNLINPGQYEFQQNISTCHALINLIDGITNHYMQNNVQLECVLIWNRHSTQSTKHYYVRKWNFLVSVVWHSNGLIIIWKTESSLCPLTNVTLICEIFHMVSHRVQYWAPDYLFYILMIRVTCLI